MVALCAALASPAWADNEFTLARSATSAGDVAVDAAGNAYVTWDNTQGMPMFCKVAPGAKRCADPIRLPPLTVTIRPPGAPGHTTTARLTLT